MWDKNIDDDENEPKQQRAYYTDEQLIETIDYLLKSMDMNGDGYIDYTEYKTNSESNWCKQYSCQPQKMYMPCSIVQLIYVLCFMFLFTIAIEKSKSASQWCDGVDEGKWESLTPICSHFSLCALDQNCRADLSKNAIFCFKHIRFMY